jgi:hypothetical protein
VFFAASTNATPLVINAGQTLTLGNYSVTGTAIINGTLNMVSGTVSLPDNGELSGSGTVLFNVNPIAGSAKIAAVSGTLTIDPGLTVTGGGADVQYFARSAQLGNPSLPLTNSGRIVASGPGAMFVVAGSSISNAGQIEARNGAVIGLDTQFTMAGIGSLDYHEGSLMILGTLDNSNQILQIDNAHGGVYLGSGYYGPETASVLGGTVATSDGKALIIPSTSRARLDNVDVNGQIRVRGALLVPAGQSFQGNADIFLANPQYIEDIGEIHAESGATTIASGVKIHGGIIPSSYSGAHGAVGNSNQPLINQGKIAADVAGENLYLLGNSITNSGTFEADSGASIVAKGSVSFASGSHFIVSGTGSMSIAGDLNLSTFTDYLDVLPGTYNATPILTWTGARTGAFSNLTPGIFPTYDNVNKRLTITGTVVPEPELVTVLASSWLTRRRRRVSA